MANVTTQRWREAQSAEAGYWHGLTVMELLRISAEKPIFLFTLGPELCSKLFDGKKILEIGVGPIGLSLASFYRHKERIQELIKTDPLSRIHLEESGLMEELWAAPFTRWVDSLTNEGEYRQITGEELDFVEAFDCVITYNVLDHVHDPKQILSNAYRALRPGGELLVGVDCLSVIGRLKFEHYIRRAYKGSVLAEAHPYTFLPSHVSKMMKDVGFRGVESYGVPSLIYRWLGGATRPAFVGRK